MGLRVYGQVVAELIGAGLNNFFLDSYPRIDDWTEKDYPYGYDKSFKLPNGSIGAVRVPVPIWYIEGAEKKILVDTGFTDCKEVEIYAKQLYRKEPDWTIPLILSKWNLKPEDIDIVLHTHLHFDHYANDELFPKATFIVQRDEIPWAISPPKYGLYYYKEFAHHILQVMDRVEAIEGDREIVDDVEVWKLGGHSPGSMAVAVKTDVGTVALSGDVICLYENLWKMWPVGAVYRLDQLIEAYQRLKREADIVVPNHDWRFWKDNPQGDVTKVPSKP